MPAANRATRHSSIGPSDAGRSCPAPLRNNVVMKEDRRVAAVLVRYSLRLSACVGLAVAVALAVVATTVGIAPAIAAVLLVGGATLRATRSRS